MVALFSNMVGPTARVIFSARAVSIRRRISSVPNPSLVIITDNDRHFTFVASPDAIEVPEAHDTAAIRDGVAAFGD